MLLRLGETATTCDECQFTYVEPKAEVTSITNLFFVKEDMHKITVYGTGLCPTESQATLLIDEKKQEFLSCDQDEITFKLLGVNDRVLRNFALILNDGYPKGQNEIIDSRKPQWIAEYITDVQPRKGM